MKRVPVLAIDGPVGVGKSTVAQRAAASLGFFHLNTGAMYRAVVWKYLQLAEEKRDEGALVSIARGLHLEMGDGGSVFVEGEDVTLALREEEISRNVYLSADSRGVREALVAEQRRLGLQRPSVLEGRDITTVVFPDAAWKIYLDAAPEERARRRVLQLEGLGRPADFDKIRQDLVERDHRDRNREWGALQIADDATIVDTTDLAEDTVVSLICAYVLGNPVEDPATSDRC